MIRVVFRRLAEADVHEARDWYDRQDSPLGTQFVGELRATVRRVRELPRQFPEMGQNVRRALLHRFPYALYFVLREESVIVVAVLHQRRRPAAWKRRARVETGE